MTTAKTPTVLVPVDFSPASAAGIRFALQWASQQKVALVCVHIAHILRPTSWSDSRYRSYAKKEKQRLFKQLNAFVTKVCKRAGALQPDLSYLLLESMSPDLALEQLCRRRKDIDFVCIGTNGASGLKRLFGTRTGNLITHSTTPVIAVPASYRRRPIKRILYAGDLSDYVPEIDRLIELAIPLKAQVRLLHLNYLGEMWLEEETVRTVFNERFHYPLEVSIVHADPNLSVRRNLQRAIAAFKPSMAVLFTRHRDSFVQRLLYPSVAEGLSFQLTGPLLVFPGRRSKTKSRRTLDATNS